MVSGIAAKSENGTNTMNITIKMVTGKTATTIVTTTETAIKIPPLVDAENGKEALLRPEMTPISGETEKATLGN